MTHKLTKQEYQNLWNSKISKHDYDETIIKINARFDYIMKKICTKLKWWDYDNGWGETCGFFIPNNYHANEESFISFHGEYTMPAPYDSCPDVPISWLWTDFEKDFVAEVEAEKVSRNQEKEIRKQKILESKARKISMKEIICSKLTKDELKFVKFK